MNLTKRLAIAPALAVAMSGLILSAAQATTEPLSVDAVDALAAASCQLDPLAPLTVDEMNPVVVAQADVVVVPGVDGGPAEITAHLFRATVNTTVSGDVQECTFGVLHRDVQLAQVQHVGEATLARTDAATSTTQSVTTEIGLGNMGRRSEIDPTTEVSLGGFLTSADVVDEPTYTISLNRKSIQVVQIAVKRSTKKAAAHKLHRQLKAAAHLEKKAAHAHNDRAAAAAQRAYDRQVAAAERAYVRATTPKTVSRPVSQPFSVSGTLTVA